MGRRSRNIAARHKDAGTTPRRSAPEAGRSLPPGVLAGREMVEALEAWDAASVTLVLPDLETGTAYLRQWNVPREHAGSFAEMMTARCGPPGEAFLDPEAAVEAAQKMILATGNTGGWDLPDSA